MFRSGCDQRRLLGSQHVGLNRAHMSLGGGTRESGGHILKVNGSLRRSRTGARHLAALLACLALASGDVP
jgi:hypothetical protein